MGVHSSAKSLQVPLHVKYTVIFSSSHFNLKFMKMKRYNQTKFTSTLSIKNEHKPNICTGKWTMCALCRGEKICRRAEWPKHMSLWNMVCLGHKILAEMLAAFSSQLLINLSYVS